MITLLLFNVFLTVCPRNCDDCIDVNGTAECKLCDESYFSLSTTFCRSKYFNISKQKEAVTFASQSCGYYYRVINKHLKGPLRLDSICKPPNNFAYHPLDNNQIVRCCPHHSQH